MRWQHRGVLVVIGAAALEGCTPTPREPAAVAPSASSVAADSVDAAKGSAPSVAPAASSARAAEGTAAPAPEPLEARRERVVRAAMESMGAKANVEVVADYYLLIGSAAALAGSREFVERILEAYFHGRFDKGVSEPLPILLFADAAGYQAYCQREAKAPCISRFGFFEPRDYRLVMNLGPGIGTLSHELVHPILEEDFPGAPTWLNEGIASLFEAPVMPKRGEIHGVKNWRWPRLITGLSSAQEHEHATITHLMGTTTIDFRDEKEDLHYAAARYLCQWLDGKGLLWPFYHRYRDHRVEDPSGAASFEAVVGQSASAAQATWERWVRAL